MAARIGAPADARQFVADKRVGSRFHDGNHEARKGIAGRDETAHVAAGHEIGIEASGTGTASKHAVDFDHGILAHLVLRVPAFGQGTERRAHPSRVHQPGSCGGRLQDRTPADTGGAFLVYRGFALQPRQECLEVAQQVPPGHLRGGVRIHEVEPESRPRGDRPGKSIARIGPPHICGGSGHMVEAVRQRLLVHVPASKPVAGYFLTFLLPMSDVILPWLHHAVVGSTNPVKIAAASAILTRLAPAVQVTGLAVPSGVPDQPIGDDETQAGARQRARAALVASPAAQLGIGLEGGVVELPGGALRSCAWAVVVDREGREGLGGSLSMPLPERVAARIRAGEELGYAMDAEARTSGTKHGKGAVGILTAGLVDRQRAYEPMLAYALAPWLAPEMFAPRTTES